jgi:hypothetical protein
MYLFLIGVSLLLLIIGLFWLKDYLQNPLLARIAYSGLAARLAVIGGVFVLLGLLLMMSELA